MQFNSQMHFSLTRVASSSVRLRDMVNPKYKVRASSSSSNRDGCIETRIGVATFIHAWKCAL
jgi:hypothetical protein